MSSYLTEAVGTFFLVLTIGLTVLAGTLFAPLAIGSILMAMVYMGGHISGAHYNPAVSIAALIGGKMARRDLLPYIAAQLVGAMLASFSVFVILGETFVPSPGADAGLLAVLMSESFFTFAVVMVVLNVAMDDATAGNSFYGVAIGVVVMAGIFAVGDVSGGVFNPAVGAGFILVDAFVGDGSLANLWVYIVGPIIGGLVAVKAFDIQHLEVGSE
jgi:aquaporin Z